MINKIEFAIEIQKTYYDIQYLFRELTASELLPKQREYFRKVILNIAQDLEKLADKI